MSGKNKKRRRRKHDFSSRGKSSDEFGELNNSDQKKPIINVEQDKLGKEEIIEKNNKYEEQKLNKS